jgi:hypothetical protein
MKPGPYALLLLASATAGACNPPTRIAADSPPPDKPATLATSPASGTKLGDPITAAKVSLGDIARQPAAYAGKTVATAGTVTAVCQAMGCWMEIKDDVGEAHVKMHGHSFFIPKTSSGRKARVQAVVEQTNPDEECSEEAAKQTGKPVAKLQLDATGVELLD